MRESVCAGCAKTFVLRKPRQKFCTVLCGGKTRYAQDRMRVRTVQKHYYETHKAAIVLYGRNWRGKRDKIRPWAPLLGTAKYRAKKESLPFDLTQEWAIANWTGYCAVSGLPFLLNQKRSVFSPTIDKIIPEMGYAQNNCRFVLFGVNALKYNGSDLDMLRIATAITTSRSIPVAGILGLPE